MSNACVLLPAESEYPNVEAIRKAYPAASHFVVVRDVPESTDSFLGGSPFVLPVASGNGDALTAASLVDGARAIVDHMIDGRGDVNLYVLVPVARKLYDELVDALYEEELAYVESLNVPGADLELVDISHDLRVDDIVEALAPTKMAMEVFGADAS